MGVGVGGLKVGGWCWGLGNLTVMLCDGLGSLSVMEIGKRVYCAVS